MSKISAFVLSAAFALMAAVSANATTLATFSISGGNYSVVDGNSIAFNGNFQGDITGLSEADPFDPLPLVFGTTITADGETFLTTDGAGIFPAIASPAELFMGAIFLQNFLGNPVDAVTGEPLLDYVLTGEDRPDDGTDVFNAGIADVFFTFSGVQTPTTISGTFSAMITANPNNPFTLTELINGSLADLDLLGTTPDSVVFPSDGKGEFEVEFELAAVPLPAGLPLLGAGLLGLVLFRRRRSA